MSKRWVLLAVMLAVTAAFTAGADARRGMQVGLFDDAQVFTNPDKAFTTFRKVRAQVVRVNLSWGGRTGVAVRRPKNVFDPADPAYKWGRYDDIVRAATKNKIKILFSIVTTPRWAGGGSVGRFAPKNWTWLRGFARAAAFRYSGKYKPEGADKPLGSVRMWMAWNEPNNPIFLWPQFKKVKGHYVAWSPRLYARICSSVYSGIKAVKVKSQVACGGTAPRGNNQPRSRRPSMAPTTFLRALKGAGLRRFDVYAHHPYSVGRSLTPKSKPKRYDRSTVMLGNIDDLIKLLTQLYGKKHLWITEYGWQTNPPDRYFGVSWRKQARYLSQSFSIARKNPRIDLMTWFLIRDDRRIAGWQSGFYTSNGRKKPAYDAFRRLPH